MVQFDSELGYILGNYTPPDGLDGSLTISTTQKNGARTSVIYRNLPCRINTYGNSFTACDQVGDYETWQEYLAAHIGEPIRNFGVGGYGVYQAYRRMLRTEITEHGAEYVIDRMVEFVGSKNKKVLFVLFCPDVSRQLISTGNRYDQPIVDYLRQKGLRYFDMNLVHVADYRSFSLTLEEYMNRYFIGHYNPKGNHFFAFAIKDAIVNWLNPKPFTYRGDGKLRIDFREGYLPE